MKGRIPELVLTGAVMVAVLFTGCSNGQESAKSDTGTIELLNVSYDPTREFYAAYNELFCDYWKEKSGQEVKITQSHGGPAHRRAP